MRPARHVHAPLVASGPWLSPLAAHPWLPTPQHAPVQVEAAKMASRKAVLAQYEVNHSVLRDMASSVNSLRRAGQASGACSGWRGAHDGRTGPRQGAGDQSCYIHERRAA